jgi:hypothetical protein
MTAAPGQVDGAAETDLCFGRVSIALGEKQRPSAAMNLGFVHAFGGLLGNLPQRREASVRHAGPAICLGQKIGLEPMVPLPPGRAHCLMQARELGCVHRFPATDTRQ